MTKKKPLYKYRGLKNLEFALDIFVNKRLFAANYKDLNDPMEGRYIYEKGSLTPDQLRSIRGGKAAYNVLSLSRTYKNVLMWSYYSEGHSGFAVGIKINDPDTITEPVRYVDDLELREDAGGLNYDDTAKLILTRKLKLWSHEEEVRIFKKNISFVKVDVVSLTFGMRANEQTKELITNIAKMFCPGVRVDTIRREQLNTGEMGYFEV